MYGDNHCFQHSVVYFIPSIRLDMKTSVIESGEQVKRLLSYLFPLGSQGLLGRSPGPRILALDKSQNFQ